MKEILTITKQLQENMKNQIRLFLAGVRYADKRKLKKLKSVYEIYEILILLDIDLQHNCIKYSNSQKCEGSSEVEIKKCMDTFLNDLSAKFRLNEVSNELQTQLMLTVIEMKKQWK